MQRVQFSAEGLLVRDKLLPFSQLFGQKRLCYGLHIDFSLQLCFFQSAIRSLHNRNEEFVQILDQFVSCIVRHVCPLPAEHEYRLGTSSQ